MKEINISDTRRRISDIITMVERGEEFIILRQGQPIARITQIKQKNTTFPDMTEFRSEIGAPTDDESLSETIVRMRRGARY